MKLQVNYTRLYAYMEWSLATFYHSRILNKNKLYVYMVWYLASFYHSRILNKRKSKGYIISLLFHSPLNARLSFVLKFPQIMVSYDWKVVHLSDLHDLHNIPTSPYDLFISLCPKESNIKNISLICDLSSWKDPLIFFF